MDESKFLDKLNKDPFSAFEFLLNHIESDKGNQAVIQDFLKISPKCDDILSFLQTNKLPKEKHVVIFDLLRYILLSYSKDDSNNDASLHITRWVLQNQNCEIIYFLSPSNSHLHLKASTVHLLAGMVLSSNLGGQEVLTLLDMDQINFVHLSNIKHREDIKNVRIPFMYLILAFLNTSAEMVYRIMKKINLACIFYGLSNLPSEIFIKLLNLLHKAILLNENITKRTKLELFSPKNCGYLIKWYYAEPSVTLYSLEELTKIKTALHELMITLCSDPTFGIVYEFHSLQELDEPESKKLQVLYILYLLKDPWTFPEGLELTQKVLNVCPYFSKLMMSRVTLVKLTYNKAPDLISLMPFITLLHEKYEPWIDLEVHMQSKFDEGINLLIPPMSNLLLKKFLNLGNYDVKNLGILFILTLLNKGQKMIQWVDQLILPNEKMKMILKDKIHSHLKEIVPGADFFNNILEFCVHRQRAEHSEEKWLKRDLEMANIIKSLIVMVELWGFQFVVGEIHLASIFKSFISLPKHLITKNDSSKIVMKLMMQILLMGQQLRRFEYAGLLENSAKGQTYYNETLFENFIHAYYIYKDALPSSSSDTVRKDVKELILKLISGSLSMWGLSSYCENKIILWLDNIEEKNREISMRFLSAVIVKAISNHFIYLDVLLSFDSEYQMKNNTIQIIEKLKQATFSDNVDVTMKEVVVPFSCLVLAAIDVLKEDSSSLLVEYFSNVIENYINHAENPFTLAEYVLNNKNLISHRTKQYLRACIYQEFADVPLISPTQDMPPIPPTQDVRTLKILFTGGNFSAVSDFCKELFHHTNLSHELVEISQHMCFYFKLKGDVAQKFSLYLLKNILNMPQTLKDSIQYLDMFEYLSLHPFMLVNYQPFLPPDDLNVEISRMLCLIMENYPSLHDSLRPYWQKAINEFKDIFVKEYDFWDPLSIFLSKDTFVTPDEVEKLIYILLNDVEVYSKNHVHLLEKLVKFLIDHAFPLALSNKLMNLFTKKMLILSQEKNHTDQSNRLVICISSALHHTHDFTWIHNLNGDQVKSLLMLKSLDLNLSCILLCAHPSVVFSLPKNWINKATTFSRKVILIAEILKLKHKKIIIHFWLTHLKEDLIQWIHIPSSEKSNAYREILAYMIQNNLLDSKERQEICTKLCDGVLSKNEPLPPHLEFIIPLFTEMGDLDDLKPYHMKLLHILLHGLTVTCTLMDERVLTQLLSKDSLAIILQKLDPQYISKKMISSEIWSHFALQVLKVSFLDTKNGPTLLKLLTKLYTMIHINSSQKRSAEFSAHLFAMLLSHSQYTFVMVNQEKQEELKEQVLFLQLELVKRHPEIRSEKHVPLLLAAYGATMSISDQILFELVFLYEESGLLKSYKPTVWGSHAISCFAVEKGPDELPLQPKKPKTKEILTHINTKKVIETALNFDMELGLLPGVVHAEDPTLYDQRFLLNLFGYLVQHPNVSPINLLKKGAMAVALAALSSRLEAVWAVGAKLLADLGHHLETSTKHPNMVKLWLNFLYIIARGLEGRRVRIPSLMVQFLVKISQMFSMPQYSMYETIANYMWLKQSIPLFEIPGIYLWLFSTNSDSGREQLFLLDTLAKGIRDEVDWAVCNKMLLPTYILSIMTSPIEQRNVRVLCLKIVNSMVKIPKAARCLVLEHSLLVQLPHVMDSFIYLAKGKENFHLEELVQILSSLWHMWKILAIESIDEAFSNESRASGNPTALTISSEKRHADGNHSRSKRRKLSTSEVTIENPERNASLSKDEFDIGCKELFICLERLTPMVFSKGTTSMLARCFIIIKEILTHPHIEKEVIPPSTWLKQKMKIWISDFSSSIRFKPQKDPVLDHPVLNQSESDSPYNYVTLCNVVEELSTFINKDR